MLNHIKLFVIISILLLNGYDIYAEVLILKSGEEIETTYYWKSGNQIKCYSNGTTLTFNESEVDMKATKKAEKEARLKSKPEEKAQNNNINKDASSYADYKGYGDDIVNLKKPDNNQPVLLHIIGNRENQHFAITSYDANGNRIKLLVNTTKYYEGFVVADIGQSLIAKTLEIKAAGSWIVKVYPIGSAKRIEAPGEKTGSGDDVLLVKGTVTGVAQISGNQSNSHFAITAYDNYGRRLKLLVNTTKQYDGKVIIPKNTYILEIKVVDNWSIKLL